MIYLHVSSGDLEAMFTTVGASLYADVIFQVFYKLINKVIISIFKLL